MHPGPDSISCHNTVPLVCCHQSAAKEDDQKTLPLPIIPDLGSLVPGLLLATCCSVSSPCVVTSVVTTVILSDSCPSSLNAQTLDSPSAGLHLNVWPPTQTLVSSSQ